MAAFHVLHWIPDPRLHIFNGYNEVIETVVWGLRALGHDVTYAVNSLRQGAVPLVFGAQLMPRGMLAALPPDAILYNLEQLHGLRATGRALDDLAWAARRFATWDYSTANIDVWRELGIESVAHLPIGYAPCLSRIDSSPARDIDVLIYGAPSASRLQVLAELCGHGLSAMFFCGLYREARDALIARSRLVLCLTSNAASSIFSVVRASYLLANRKAVIADLASAERDIANGVAFARREDLAAVCGHYLAHPKALRSLEESGFEVISRRDIRPMLATALDAVRSHAATHSTRHEEYIGPARREPAHH